MIEPTSEEFNQRVCEKFNTSLQQVRKDVEVLKEWIRQQPHLPQSSSDTLLTNMLIASKNRMELAKQKIDDYYTARLMFPNFFLNRCSEDERWSKSEDQLIVLDLPKLTPDGCRVHMASFGTGDAKNFDLLTVCIWSTAYGDISLNTRPFLLSEYVVLDCKHLTSTHLLKLTPTIVRDAIYYMQKVTPFFLTGFIVFNTPSFVDVAYTITRPFVKKKMMERVHVHKEGPEILERYFPKEMLPRDYGGEEETCQKLHENWKRFMREHKDWLLRESAVTVDEKKRVSGSRTQKEFQAMQGSFKNLCVD